MICWSGNMAISVRRMPQLGRIKDNNVLYATGYSGHGVAPTHMSGRILAEAVDGNTKRLDIMNKMYHIALARWAVTAKAGDGGWHVVL